MKDKENKAIMKPDTHQLQSENSLAALCNLIIAVDGYSSTGKSTVSKILAARLGYTYIDTGAMYRMVTYGAFREKLLKDGKITDEARLKECLLTMRFDFVYNADRERYESFLDGKLVEDEIRGMDVSEQVSYIASLPYVREVLVEKQREMGRRGGVVMDGRDIGSVVFPDADVKFFMTAAPEVRAQRRYDEMRQKGDAVSYEEVERNVRQRDEMDSNRKVGPLVKLPEAIEVDTGNRTIEEVVELMYQIIKKRQDEGRD